jgi:putative transposase
MLTSLPHARAMLEAWRRDYNAERPHSSLGWLTPLAYAACLQSPSSQRDSTLPFYGGSASCPVASATESGFTDPRTLASTG